jgi:hypothetical protein
MRTTVVFARECLLISRISVLVHSRRFARFVFLDIFASSSGTRRLTHAADALQIAIAL